MSNADELKQVADSAREPQEGLNNTAPEETNTTSMENQESVNTRLTRGNPVSAMGKSKRGNPTGKSSLRGKNG
jgi:hypothetical protein